MDNTTLGKGIHLEKSNRKVKSADEKGTIRRTNEGKTLPGQDMRFEQEVWQSPWWIGITSAARRQRSPAPNSKNARSPTFLSALFARGTVLCNPHKSCTILPTAGPTGTDFLQSTAGHRRYGFTGRCSPSQHSDSRPAVSPSAASSSLP